MSDMGRPIPRAAVGGGAPSPEDKARAPRERGHTYIEDGVVAVIARIAAEEIQGVHQIGEPNLRAIVGRRSRTQGVDAQVGMEEAAVDLEITVEFGFSIRDTAAEIRERVIIRVEEMTGRRVVEVNVFVTDVHVPKAEPRKRRQLD